MIKQQNILHGALYAAAILLTSIGSSLADSHTWAGLGITGNWSLPANWAANNPPTAGEAAPVLLFFPSGAARLTNTNNVAGLVVDGLSITGNGYTLHGSGSGTNITFHDNGANTFFVSSTGNTLASTLNLTLSGAVVFNISGSLTISGKLLGSGGFIKNNPGTLTLSAVLDNTFTGGVTVNDGALDLAAGYPFFASWVGSAAVPGPLTVANPSEGFHASVVLLHSDQIADGTPVTVGDNGSFSLNGYNETIGGITFSSGGTVTNTGTGVLTLAGQINVNDVEFNSCDIYSIVSLGGATRSVSLLGSLSFHNEIRDGGAAAGLDVSSPGAFSYLYLFASNSFSGTLHLSGPTSLQPRHNFAGGSTAGGTVVESGAEIDFGTPLSIAGEPLTLNGAGSIGLGAVNTSDNVSWSGLVTLASDSKIHQSTAAVTMTFSGSIQGPGGLICGGPGTVAFTGAAANTYLGTTSVTNGTLALNKNAGIFAVAAPLQIGLNGLLGYTGVVRLGANDQIANPPGVTVLESGLLDLNGFNETINSLTLVGGTVQTGAGILALGGNVTANPHQYFSIIYGTLSLGGATRTFNTIGNLDIVANLVDGPASAGLIKTGGGELALEGVNTFTGTAVATGGILSLAGNAALGSSAQGTFVTNAVLQLIAAQTTGHPLTLAGSSSIFFYYTNAWNAPVTLAPSVVVTNFQASDSLTFNGAIGGAGPVTLNGPGTVIFSGAQDNTYTANTYLTLGTLLLQKPAGFRAIPGNLVIGVDVGTLLSAQVMLGSDNQIINGAVGYVQINNTGRLNLDGHNQSLPALYLNDNAGVETVGGLLTLQGDVTVAAPNGGDSGIYGRLSLGGANRVITTSGFFSILTVGASVSDGGASAGFKATGGGSVYLSGSNSFSGPVMVDYAFVWLQNDFALGATNSGVTVTNFGILALDGVKVSNEALTISGTGLFGTAALYALNTNSWSGPVQLAGDTTFSMNFTDSAFTVSGPVSGPGGLELDGDGIFRFAGTATNTATGQLTSYVHLLELARTNATAVSGPVQLGGGTLRLRAANQILDTASVNIAAGAWFDLSGFDETIGELLRRRAGQSRRRRPHGGWRQPH